MTFCECFYSGYTIDIAHIIQIHISFIEFLFPCSVGFFLPNIPLINRLQDHDEGIGKYH